MTERLPRGFWTLWMSVAVNLTGFGIIIPLLPLWAERFGAGPTTIGFLFAAYSLAQFVFSPVWGRISDRVGRKPIMLVTILGSAIGSLLTGAAGSLAFLFAARIIDGGSGASIAVARAAVADSASPADRPRLMGLLGAAFGLGFVAGPILGSVAQAWGPSAPFYLAAGISVVNLIATAIRMTEPPARSTTPPRRLVMRGLAGEPRDLIVITLVSVAGFAAFESTFSLLANRRIGLTESGVALTFAAVGVVLVVVQGGMIRPLTSRFGEQTVLMAGLTIMTAAFIVLSFDAGRGLFFPTLAVLAAGQGLVAPTLSSRLATVSDAGAYGWVLGIQQSASGLGRVIGPAIGGSLFATGEAAPYLVAAAGVCVSLAIYRRRTSLFTASETATRT